jgi:hypothetical protein
MIVDELHRRLLPCRLAEGARLCRYKPNMFAEKAGPEQKLPDIVRKET